MNVRTRAEVDEKSEEVRGRRAASARVREGVKDREGAAGRECVAHPAEQGGDLVRRQVVHEVEAEHRVVAATQLEVAGRRVPVAEPHPVRQPGRGDDLAADRRAAGQVEHGSRQPGMAAAQLHGVQAVAAADVEQSPGASRQPQLPGHLGGAQPGELVLAADVALPERIARRSAVRPGGTPAAGHLVEFRPPGPVVRGSRDVARDRQPGQRVEPAPGAAAEPVAAVAGRDVAGRSQAVEQQPGGQRIQAEVGRQFRGGGGPLRQPGRQAGAHRRDQDAGQPHAGPGFGGGSRDDPGEQREPLGRVGTAKCKPHTAKVGADRRRRGVP